MLIPAGVFALFVVAGIAGSGDDTTDIRAASDSADARVADAPVDPAQAAADKAAADKAAAQSAGQKNAARAAESYPSFAPFSRSGLIQQLEFEGCSTADATHGQNADWKAQAAKAAQNYLEMTAFSRSGLIQQLEFEGYTREQAECGVSQTGL